MPIVTATPRSLRNGEVITEFTDVTSTTLVTYTYTVQQSALLIENSGVSDIFLTVGIYNNQVIKADTKWRADFPFTSFSIRSNVNSQEFIATAYQNDIEDNGVADVVARNLAVQGRIQIPTENLFDKNKVTPGGYFDGTGVWISTPNYVVSDFIPVEEGQTYIQNTIGYRTYWDVNKTYIQSTSGLAYLTVPTGLGIKYIRAISTIPNRDTEMFVKGIIYPSQYIPYTKYAFDPSQFVTGYSSKKSKIDGLIWNAMGDSLTANSVTVNYLALITQSHGVNTRNHGLGGRAIASRGGTDSTYPPVVTTYMNMPNAADIVTVFAGTNDYSSQVPLGTISSTLNTEFYGALNIVALGLIEKYPGKKIGFITPIQRKDDNLAVPLTEYVNAIKEIGVKYGIPVLDLLNNCGLYPKSNAINTAFFSSADGLHPNAEGYKVITPRIAAFLESL